MKKVLIICFAIVGATLALSPTLSKDRMVELINTQQYLNNEINKDS